MRILISEQVSDLMCKGIALVCEGLSLLEYFKVNTTLGKFGPFGVTGISMGGHMAALAGLRFFAFALI